MLGNKFCNGPISFDSLSLCLTGYTGAGGTYTTATTTTSPTATKNDAGRVWPAATHLVLAAGAAAGAIGVLA
jgi:hypothetical protein